jgi:uncharacterized membrane protein
MLKILLPIMLVAISLVTLVFLLNRWRQLDTPAPTKAVQALCIGCVVAGVLALLLFYS